MTATAPPPLRQEFGHECALCTQPCPADDTFCCMGCRNVYTILQESGAIVEGADPRDSELFRRSLALSRRSDIERVADKVSRIFVPGVIALAALTALLLIMTGVHPAEALLRAITVLVIACPCALGIATPRAITAATPLIARIRMVFMGLSIRLSPFPGCGTRRGKLGMQR